MSTAISKMGRLSDSLDKMCSLTHRVLQSNQTVSSLLSRTGGQDIRLHFNWRVRARDKDIGLKFPYELAMDDNGFIFIADDGNKMISKI